MGTPASASGTRFRASLTPAASLVLPRVFCVLAMLFVMKAQAADSSVEAAIKATYLYKFPPFIEWPANALASLRTFTLCVVGVDPLGAVLDQAVAGQTIKDRPIVVRRMNAISDDAGCQLVYATGSVGQSVASILAVLRGKPVVTVTDSARDPESKGILNFVIVDNRVRFEIDDNAAAAAGLTISSKLLSLATRVRSGN